MHITNVDVDRITNCSNLSDVWNTLPILEHYPIPFFHQVLYHTNVAVLGSNYKFIIIFGL